MPCPELVALGKEHDAIINGTIQSLKQELGNQSFQKLNTWVDLYFRSVPDPETGSGRPRVVYPSTEQAPAIDT